MLRKIFFMLEIAILTSGSIYAQNATIKGRITETDGKTPIESATIRLMQDGMLVMGAIADYNGNYILSPVASGTYDLIVSYVGYQDFKLQGLKISGNGTYIQDVSLGTGDQVLEGVVITAVRPIFDAGTVTSEQRVTSEEMNLYAGKSVDNILATMSGVTNSAAGMSVRGDRPGEQSYQMDGMPTSMLPPRGAMSEMALIQGAIPAEYGDAAVVEIETKSFTRVHHGNIEAGGSVDGYNNFRLDFNLTGPIAKKKNGTIFMGYMLAGSGVYTSGGVYRGGTYRASQETIDYLTENPFKSTEELSSAVVAKNLNYVTKYQEGEILSLEEKRRRRVQNAWRASGDLIGKLDIKLSDNVDLMLRGSVGYIKLKEWSFSNSLFNSINNGMGENLNWSVNARLTHRIPDSKSTSKYAVKNIYYRLYGYYSRINERFYSDVHKDNLFDYGYIGKFDYDLIPYYSTVTKEFEGQIRTMAEMQTFQRTNTQFTPGGKNPALEQYTLSAYERAGGSINDYLEEMPYYSGLLNGSAPSGFAYGFFNVPGMPYNKNSKSLSERISAKAAFSFAIGDHAIKFGFDFEQNNSRGYDISPYGLWQIMRAVTNRHIDQLEDDVPIGVYDETGRFLDTINYARYVNTERQTTFDRSIRTKLGAADNEYINIDKYDPSMYSLDMFSPIDLFNEGNSIISYYGYNYTGTTVLNKPVTMDDMKKWFDGNNSPDFTNIGVYKPLRISAYIQDKFSIKSLYFDLGLRLDVFDKNQPYVKDMFLYREAYTVAEAQSAGKFSSETTIPDFISDNPNDYYVYVKDVSASTISVTAYRSGNTWYNSDGQEVTDANALAVASGSPQLLPFLKNSPDPSDITNVHYAAFEDYTPTFANGGISLSPRIAFAFTVAENSKFTASYNIITKNHNNRLNPVTYLYFEQYSTASNSNLLANPGLKPERNINYEIGFEQALNKNTKVTFLAYYSEKRDQLQAYYFNQAYPRSYYSYTNMDFGTTQGFQLGLVMRRTKNLSFDVTYTLQFAKGTGSSSSSTLALIRSGAPNLRTLTSLDFDQRNKLALNAIFMFSEGGDYNGPISRKAIKGTDRSREIKWLQSSGISLQFNAGSGFPYTQSSEVYSTIVNQGARVVKGKVNGSRMPWIFNCDLNIWKGFVVVLKDSDDPRAKKTGRIGVSLAIQNLLELDQIQSVYSYTGSATDDGFLTSSKYQQYVAQQENITSYQDYYSIVMEGYNRLGGPRQFTLRISFDF